jgi:hypothetical protein
MSAQLKEEEPFFHNRNLQIIFINRDYIDCYHVPGTGESIVNSVAILTIMRPTVYWGHMRK